MSNFVFPIIHKKDGVVQTKAFRGIGVYIFGNKSDQSSVLEEYGNHYGIVRANRRQIENARYAVISLFPGCTDNEKQIYELLPLGLEVHGASRDLAYFLTLISQAHMQQSNLINRNKDFWCTGSIRKNENGFYLKQVTDNEFNLKLNAFLDDKLNINRDLLFIVPEGNIHPEHRKECRTKNVNICSLDDLCNDKSQSGPQKKTVLKVNMGSSQLIDLINLLFDSRHNESYGSNKTNHKTKLIKNKAPWNSHIIKDSNFDKEKGIASALEPPNDYSRVIFNSANPNLINLDYVEEIRADEENKILSCLREKRIVEIYAPAGTGKSALIQHIASRLGHSVLSLQIKQARTSSNIAIDFIKELYGHYEGVSSGDSLIQKLTSTDIFFWIKEYDKSSFNVMVQFFDELRSYYNCNKETFKAYWIIESHDPISKDNQSFELTPLSENAIVQVLFKFNKTTEINNINQVIQHSKGNPRKAKLLSSTVSSFDVIDNEMRSNDLIDLMGLDMMGKDILQLMSILFPLCPLGLTDQLIISIYGVINKNKPFLKKELTQKVQELLGTLEAHKLAGVITIEKIENDFFAFKVIDKPQRAKYFINFLSTELAVDLSEARNKVEWNALKAKIKDSLVDIGTECNVSSLEYITASILVNDFEPFFYSTFRYSSLGDVVKWLDEIDFSTNDPWQLFLVKNLRALNYLLENQDPTILEEMEVADINKIDSTASQNESIKLIIASRAKAFSNFDDSDLRSLIKKADSAKDQNVKADVYFSILYALFGKFCEIKSREVLIWKFLNHFKKNDYEILSYPYFVIRMMTLIYLNKKHGRDKSIKNEEVVKHVSQSGQELIQVSLAINNIQLLSEVCFYMLRTQELTDYGKLSIDQLNLYRETLDFLSKTNTKYIKGIQILLTHGSLLRHYCLKKDNLDWEHYWPLMKEALVFYFRALQDSKQINHSMHMLNSISYCFKFIINSFKFIHNPGKKIYGDDYYSFVGEIVKSCLLNFHYFNNRFDIKNLNDAENGIYKNVFSQAPLMLPLYMIYDKKILPEFKPFQQELPEKLIRLDRAYTDNFESINKKAFFNEINPVIQLLNFLKLEHNVCFGEMINMICQHLTFIEIHMKRMDILKQKNNKNRKKTAIDKVVEKLHNLIVAKDFIKSDNTESAFADQTVIPTFHKVDRLQIVSIMKKLMTRPRGNIKCHIEIQPLESAISISRDMTFSDATRHSDFRLNSKVNIGYYYSGLEGPVDVTIFDVGTTGKLSILMPDDVNIEGKINWFPDAYRNQSISLTGRTGIENAFAVATPKTVNIRNCLNLNVKNIAHELTGQDSINTINLLTNTLLSLPNDSWAIGEFEFEIQS